MSSVDQMFDPDNFLDFTQRYVGRDSVGMFVVFSHSTI